MKSKEKFVGVEATSEELHNGTRTLNRTLTSCAWMRRVVVRSGINIIAHYPLLWNKIFRDINFLLLPSRFSDEIFSGLDVLVAFSARQDLVARSSVGSRLPIE